MESDLSRKVNHSSPMMETNTADDDLTWNTTREYHKEPSATYWLPKDEEEQMRLTGVNKNESFSPHLIFFKSYNLQSRNYLKGNK